MGTRAKVSHGRSTNSRLKKAASRSAGSVPPMVATSQTCPSRLWKHGIRGSELYLRCEIKGRWRNVGVRTIKLETGHIAVRQCDLETMSKLKYAAWLKTLAEHWHIRNDSIEGLLIIGNRKA